MLALGCGGWLADGGGAATPTPAVPSNDLHALRMRVADRVAIVVDGSADPRLGARLVSAVEAELGRQGVTVVRGTDRTADLTVRLETRVRALVSFLRGHLALTAEKGDVTVAVASTEDEIHREGEFVTEMARKAVAGLLRTPHLAELAAKKNAGPAVAARPAPARVSTSAPVRQAAPTATVSPTTAAKARANRATGLYNLGHFQQALAEYEAAYMAVQDPPFLFNIAQCHRKLGNGKDAIAFYRSYLRVAPNAPNRPEVQRRIAELERESRLAR